MPQRIVIIGAGFAGMYSALAARRLISQNGRDQDIETVVIAPEPTLAAQPCLYEANPATMAAPLGHLFTATGVKFIQGVAKTMDTKMRQVGVVNTGGDAAVVDYDRLILAAGSQLRVPNVDGLKQHSFNVDQLHSAIALDEHLHSLPRASDCPARNTVIVPRAEPARPEIQKALDDYGVELKLGVAVTSVDAGGVVTSTGERIEASTVVWTGGMVATGLTQQIPGEKDGLRRLVVDENLRVAQTKHVFATGDAACAVTDEDGHTAMMSCQHALVLGRSSGHDAAAHLLGLPNRPYSQPDYGTCLDLGPNGAVVTAGWDRRVVFTGSQAKSVKQFINTTLIYPPPADAKQAFAVADPDYKLPNLEPPPVPVAVKV
ncbi:FAD-dependent pyridine nucleotide-disulfide oxidoreductase, partial [Metarhizium majus ARSEF 297]